MKITPLESWITDKIACHLPLTRQKIEQYQLDKINETIEWVRSKSAFYRQHLINCPSHIDSLQNLTQFPFTTDEDIRVDSLAFVCVSQSNIQRVVTLNSSGTTGDPKRLFFTLEDQELTIDFFKVGMSTLVDSGDKVLILLPVKRPGSVGDLLETGLRRLNVQGYKYGLLDDPMKVIDILHQEKINSIVGVPVQVLAIERLQQSDKNKYPRLNIKSILLTMDHVPEAIIQILEHAWGCNVYNHYGMTEMGLGGGVECQAHRGYHLREADLFFEIVHPQTGQLLAEGEMGEVVFTTLTRRGMPLIRYRTGDYSRFIPGECPCSTKLKTLEKVRSRIAGNLKIMDTMISLADLDEVLFTLEGVIDYSAIVKQEDSHCEIMLQVHVLNENQRDIRPEIKHALDKVPSLHYAQSHGKLNIQIVIASPDFTALSSMAKRTFIYPSLFR